MRTRPDPSPDPADTNPPAHPSTFLAKKPWEPARPSALVIACSDGRLQEPLDDFLHHQLGIADYDRLYAPGGSGALAAGAGNFVRADHFRREAAFLVTAHGIDDVHLVFHGPAADGPPEATCGDYMRRLPHYMPAQIRAQQEQDAAEIVRAGIAPGARVRLHAWRCEVTADGRVQVVPLA